MPVNTRMKRFHEYIAQNRRTECDLDRLLDDPALFEHAVISEAFSTTAVKAAAVAIVVKMSSLRQEVLRDRAADSAEKALANTIFWLASMVGMLAGGMRNDSEMMNLARRS